MQDETFFERAELLDEKLSPLSLYLGALIGFELFINTIYLMLQVVTLQTPLQTPRWMHFIFLFSISWATVLLLAATLLWMFLKNRWLGVVGGLILGGLWVWSLVSLIQAPDDRVLPAVLTGVTGLTLFSRFLMLIALMIPAFILVALYFASSRVIPVPEGEARKAFEVLLAYPLGWHYPHYVVVRERDEDERVERRIRGSMGTEFAIGSGLIITPCDHAVVVSDGLKFKGVKGPGVVYTGFFDRPMQVVDLRPQLRGGKFYGMTQDGIRIEVGTFMIFHVERGGREPHLGEPFPYDPSAAERAVLSQRIESQGDVPEDTQPRPWHEAPLVIAERILQDLLSHYPFDDLYGPYGAGEEPPREAMGREYARRMRNELEKMGIQVVAAGLSNMMPADEQVLEERVESWKADWERKVLLVQAEGEAERVRRLEQARAEAQTELIVVLGRKLSELDQIDTPVPLNLILYQFLQTLETIAIQPSFQPFIPLNMLNDLNRFQRRLQGG